MQKTISKQTRIIVAAILLTATFFSLASQTMMVTALPVIQHLMHVTLDTAQWLTTGYTLVIGIVTPLSSNLYEKFTNRTVFLGIIGTFITGTLMGCWAHQFWLLLLARLVQASASGILMTYTMTALISIYPPEKRGTIMGISSLIVSTAPAIGPTVAGFILQILSWRWLFIIVLPVMIVVWVIGFVKLPNFSPTRNIKIDVLSVGLALVGASMALTSITTFTTNAHQAWLLLIGGVILLSIFAIRQFKLTNPVLQLRIFKYRSFSTMTVICILAFMILLGTEQLIPVFTEGVTGTSSFVAGLVILPGALVNATVAVFAGRWYDNSGPQYPVFLGAALILVATLPLVWMSKHTPLWLITVDYAVRLAGNSLIFSPAMSEAFRDLTPEENSHGTALNNTLRQVAGAIAVTLCVVLAGIPRSLTVGTHLAVAIISSLAVGIIVLFSWYLMREKRTQAN